MDHPASATGLALVGRPDVGAAYGAIAEQYIELFGEAAKVRPDDLAFIDRHLSTRSGPVLDAGCGPGHLTSHLRSLGVNACGIDLVPEFIDHARASYPEVPYQLGSIGRLALPDGSVDGILAWYSLIHLPPDRLDEVLSELRRVIAAQGALVAGFFAGDQVVAFDHQVVTAYFWPVDEFAARLRRAGFTEVERHSHSGHPEAGVRPHATLAAVADEVPHESGRSSTPWTRGRTGFSASPPGTTPAPNSTW